MHIVGLIWKNKINNKISVNATDLGPSVQCHLSPQNTANLEKLTVAYPIEKFYPSSRKLPLHRIYEAANDPYPEPTEFRSAFYFLETKHFNIISPPLV